MILRDIPWHFCGSKIILERIKLDMKKNNQNQIIQKKYNSSIEKLKKQCIENLAFNKAMATPTAMTATCHSEAFPCSAEPCHPPLRSLSH